MKKKMLIAITGVFILALVLSPLLESKSTRTLNPPPTNRSGGPGDEGGSTTHRSCASTCHNSFSPAEFKTGWISSNIPQTGYVPNQTYNITVTINSPGVRYGFTASCQDSNGNFKGLLIGNDSTLVVDDVANEKSWIFQMDSTNAIASGLQHSVGYAGGLNFKTWTFSWTAPAQGTGPLTFYSSAVAGNGNASATDDSVFISSLDIVESTSLNINKVALSQIKIYPNPSNGQFQIDNIPENATIEIFNMSGQSLFKRKSTESTLLVNLPTIATGTHYVKITTSDFQSVTKMVVNY
jgi:hypothetical protein